MDVPWQNPCGLSWGAAEAMGPETSGYFARGMGRDTVAGLNVCGFSDINKKPEERTALLPLIML